MQGLTSPPPSTRRLWLALVVARGNITASKMLFSWAEQKSQILFVGENMKLAFLSLLLIAGAFSTDTYAATVCIKATVSVGGGGTSTQYYCSDQAVYDSPPPNTIVLSVGIGDPSGGGGPLGGRFNPILVLMPANGSCQDGYPMSNVNATNAFRESLVLKGIKNLARLIPDNKFYQVLFVDGSSAVYRWDQPVQNSISLDDTQVNSCK